MGDVDPTPGEMMDAVMRNLDGPGPSRAPPSGPSFETDCWRCVECNALAETLPRDEDVMENRCWTCGGQRRFRKAPCPWDAG